MIIKGKSRSGPTALATHLGNAEKNERVSVIETRGVISQDLRGALIEMDAFADGIRCKNPLYHAAISPSPPYRLSAEQQTEAIDLLEEKLGLSEHARVVVMHEKLGREHIHVVWSRIDTENMRAVSDSHNYRKHEEVSRELERRFDHERVQGAHVEREGVERPERTPSRAELRQEDRTGIKGQDVRREVTEAFRASDTAQAFKNGLENAGYLLAQGDRRDFVIVDGAGGIHSLARRIEGLKARELREFMVPIERESLPTAESAREIQLGRINSIAGGNNEQQREDTFAKATAAATVLVEDEQVKRQAQLRASRQEAMPASDYSKGADFSHQTLAAQKHHEARQVRIDKLNSGPRPLRPGEIQPKVIGESQRDQVDEAIEQNRLKASAEDKPPSKSIAGSIPANVEMTDRMQRLLANFDYDARESNIDHEQDAGPGRQSEAPGGGRTRGR